MQIDNIKKITHYKGIISSRGILTLFKKQLKKSASIIDIGSGNGILVKKMQSLFPGKEITGIDKEPQDPIIIQRDLTDTQMPDNHFDTVICMDVIEHLPDDILDKGLKEFYRILNNEGKLLITTLLEEDIAPKMCRCPQCNAYFHYMGHLQVFTKDELITLLEKKGFHIEQVITTHLGAYSLYPLFMKFLKFIRIENLFHQKIKKLFNKDIVILCSKK